ncbi:uncharacterized protein LY79DRAFT_29611 [Colletotrichum navitas]|uniref:Uncharacterized protein n=1 Tax=Colletotrichum navitas TaxID=681940 RepID=A0AAD8VD31_9PEZI|nr:uncharacterized protein LY79DRAFT_29611 [Colletotrichum navitas]KAK1600711.1 hypothetical protein LY79DRAFT_29611 [Colletotrichum navitas]
MAMYPRCRDMTTMSNSPVFGHAFCAARGHGHDVAPATSSHSKMPALILLQAPCHLPFRKGTHWKGKEFDRMRGWGDGGMGEGETKKAAARYNYRPLPHSKHPLPCHATCSRPVRLCASSAFLLLLRLAIPLSILHFHSIALPLCRPSAQFSATKGLSPHDL